MLESEIFAMRTPLRAPARRRRGRPLLMPPEELLQHVRRLAGHEQGLFRVHRTHGALYARARRLFGTWEAAVRAAGLDYHGAVVRARQAAVESRRGRAPRRRGGGSS